MISNLAKKPIAHFLLAHGAGAPMDSDWMNQLTECLVEQGISVHRFEFPYMNKRRTEGVKKPPDRGPILEKHFLDVISQFKKKPLFIGGKSMGGRMASVIANECDVEGVIVFGYPFHAPGKPINEKRLEAFLELKKPCLVLQGERDAMGSQEELKAIKFPRKIKFVYLKDGDHSLKPRKKSGFTLEKHLETSAERSLDFIKKTIGQPK